MSTDVLHDDAHAPSHIDPVTGEYNGPMFDGHDLMYLKVAAGLFVATGLEVYLSYSGLKHASLASILLALAAIKFVVVAGFFMHLKFDSPVLRRLFIAGGLLAGFCYFGLMSALGVLRTPRALLPIHWIVLIITVIVVVAMWVVPHGSGGDDEYDDDDHAGHAHAH